MVLVPVGESAVSISINGTERVNELISDDTSYDLTDQQTVDITVNGSSAGTFTQTNNGTYELDVGATSVQQGNPFDQNYEYARFGGETSGDPLPGGDTGNYYTERLVDYSGVSYTDTSDMKYRLYIKIIPSSLGESWDDSVYTHIKILRNGNTYWEHDGPVYEDDQMVVVDKISNTPLPINSDWLFEGDRYGYADDSNSYRIYYMMGQYAELAAENIKVKNVNKL